MLIYSDYDKKHVSKPKFISYVFIVVPVWLKTVKEMINKDFIAKSVKR